MMNDYERKLKGSDLDTIEGYRNIYYSLSDDDIGGSSTFVPTF
jgi:hypothetical protein